MRKKDTPTENYFERMKRRSGGRLPSKKYRYYFFDYIYFCGNLLQGKVPRTSGSLLIHSYWLFCLWGPIGIGARFSDIYLFSRDTDLAIFLIGMFLPLPFSLYRYRKDRLAAIKHRYRQSKWMKIIPPRLVARGSFILLILEIVMARLLVAR